MKENIILFGLNADPPHLGHLQVINELKKHFDQKTCFIVMPCGQHPFHKLQNASLRDRLEMTKRLFCDLKNVEVSDLEILKKQAAYTIDTLEFLKQKYPQKELFFVIAQDVANDFFSWKDPEKILQIATPIIVPRVGCSLSQELFDRFKQYKVPLIIPINSLDISSTNIREDIKEHHFSNDVPKNVLDYILEKKLYF